MSEEPKGFTVNDRRHFAPDGSLRDDPSEEQAPTSTDEAPEVSRPGVSPQPEEAVNLSGFLVSLVAEASLMLGLGEGEGGEPRIDLAGARHIIGILEMLQDKTQGRRTPDEDRLLANVLYELRMAWVQRSRSGAA
jgi:hypothetical protein